MNRNFKGGFVDCIKVKGIKEKLKKRVSIIDTILKTGGIRNV